ncbi:MAG: tetratricopeptide repeat protein, partial [Blastocatellia bacterium]
MVASMMNLGRWFCMVLILAAWTLPAFAERRAQAGDPEEMFARAVQLQKSGNTDDAIREYEGFLKVRPDRVDARSNLGAAYAHLGRYE